MSLRYICLFFLFFAGLAFLLVREPPKDEIISGEKEIKEIEFKQMPTEINQSRFNSYNFSDN